MRLDVSHQLRLEQRMKLSPRIIQAMEILQLPMLALQERIEEELSSNPCLEMREDPAEDDPPAEEATETVDRGEKDLIVKDDRSHKDDFERLTDYGDEYAEDLDWSERPARRARLAGERASQLDALAPTPAPAQRLLGYRMQQWAFVEVPDEIKVAGDAIIFHIDQDGYLRAALEELAGEIVRAWMHVVL